MSDRRKAVRYLVAVLALVAAAGLTSCAQQQQNTDTATSSTTPPPAPAMTDANVAAIAVAANKVDVETGELAKSKTTNAQVKAFAEQMVNDHTLVNQRATELVTKLAVTPEDNDISRKLLSDGETKRNELNALSGTDFDKAYVDHEVTFHQAVLDMIDNTLVPSAQNAELKALLTDVRPTIAAHLDHAKQLQAGMHPQ